MDEPFDLPPDVLGRVPLFAEIAKVLSWRGGPVNWDLARQIAVSVAASGRAQTSVVDQDRDDIAQLVRVAELWLADVASFPPAGRLLPVRALTPVAWAERAPEAVAEIVDPVANKVANAMAEQTSHVAGEEAGPLAQALGQMGPMFVGIQAGTILGHLSNEVLGDHELAFPIQPDVHAIVLPNVDGFADAFGLDRRAVRQWVAVRAAAHRMTVDGFPWVRTHFYALYHDYVSSLEVDLAAGMERLQSMDLADPSGLREALEQEGLFTTHPSESAAAAATRLGTFTAVVEAHAAAAVDALADRIGDAGRIREAFTRRSAEAGRGAQMLASFIGIDRPDQRAAAAFARTVLTHGGWAELNRIWDDPEVFPTPAEVADPSSWIARAGS